MRVHLTHQRLLCKNSATLKAQITSLVSCVPASLEGWDAYVRAVANMECALAMHVYNCSHDSLAYIREASELVGLQFEQTGVMGKRTVHQIDPKRI